jgi:hypothetical protein
MPALYIDEFDAQFTYPNGPGYSGHSSPTVAPSGIRIEINDPPSTFEVSNSLVYSKIFSYSVPGSGGIALYLAGDLLYPAPTYGPIEYVVFGLRKLLTDNESSPYANRNIFFRIYGSEYTLPNKVAVLEVDHYEYPSALYTGYSFVRFKDSSVNNVNSLLESDSTSPIASLSTTQTTNLIFDFTSGVKTYVNETLFDSHAAVLSTPSMMQEFEFRASTGIAVDYIYINEMPPDPIVPPFWTDYVKTRET